MVAKKRIKKKRIKRKGKDDRMLMKSNSPLLTQFSAFDVSGQERPFERTEYNWQS
jgi:hypothetical protein